MAPTLVAFLFSPRSHHYRDSGTEFRSVPAQLKLDSDTGGERRLRSLAVEEGLCVRNRTTRGRHIGRHRAPISPRGRYAAVVSTALVGAGVVAFGAGSALPSQSDAATTTPQADASSSSASDAEVRDERAESVGVNRASRSQRRAAAPAPDTVPDWTAPATGPVSSLFGYRAWDNSNHPGLDFAAPYGSIVKAASAGTVIYADWNGGYGMLVIIDHGTDADGNRITTRYGHNSELLVSAGDVVDTGTPIAEVGSTGYSSGAHCHFEVRINDNPTNPLDWLKERNVTLTDIDTNR